MFLRACYFAALLVHCSHVGHAQLASNTGTSCESVQLAATKLTQSRYAIRQWVGKAVLTEQFRTEGGQIARPGENAISLAGPVLNTRTVDLRFRVDMDAGHAFTEYFSRSPAVLKSIETDEEYYIEENIVQWNLTRKDDGLYTKRPGELVGKLVDIPSSQHPYAAGSTAIITRRPTSEIALTSVGSSEFHPAIVFIDGGRDIAETLERYSAQFCKGSSQLSISTTPEGAIIATKEYGIAGTSGGVIHQVAYAPEWDMFPTSILYLEDGDLECEITFAYERLSGIVLPKRYEFSSYVTQGHFKGERSVYRVIEFSNESVNQPIPATEFDIAVLGPAEGERLLDLETQQLSVFRDGTFKSSDSPSTPGSMTLVLINVLCVGVLLWWKRQRRHAARA